MSIFTLILNLLKFPLKAARLWRQRKRKLSQTIQQRVDGTYNSYTPRYWLKKQHKLANSRGWDAGGCCQKTFISVYVYVPPPSRRKERGTSSPLTPFRAYPHSYKTPRVQSNAILEFVVEFVFFEDFILGKCNGRNGEVERTLIYVFILWI